MREKIKDRGRLEHIAAAINVLLESKDKYEYGDIVDNPIVFFGFVKHVEIIGEAVYMLSKEFKESHTEVDWRVIAGMRHVLVHGYYQIKPRQLWDTIETDIAELKPFIDRYIEEAANNEEQQ